MAYDNTNKGSLGKNKTRANDRQPEYKGRVNVEGVDYWLSAWVKEANGEKFFSLSVTKMDFQKNEAPAAKQESEDDIPF